MRRTDKRVGGRRACENGGPTKETAFTLIVDIDIDFFFQVWRRSGATWEVSSFIDVGSKVHGMAFSSTGSFLITLGDRRRIQMWKFDSSKNPVLSLKADSKQESNQYPDGLISYSWMNNLYLVVGGSTKLCIYKTSRWTGAVKHVHTRRNYTHKDNVLCVDWNAVDDVLASGGDDGFIILWHLLHPGQVTPDILTRFYVKESRYYLKDPEPLPELDVTDTEDTRSLSVISFGSEGSSPSFVELGDPPLDDALEDQAVEDSEVEHKLEGIKSRAVAMRDLLKEGHVPPLADLISSYQEIRNLCDVRTAETTRGS